MRTASGPPDTPPRRMVRGGAPAIPQAGGGKLGEIPRRKAMGAKAFRRYASPAAGYFASEPCKERKIV